MSTSPISDPEVRAFVAEVEAAAEPAGPTEPPATQRAAYDRMAARFRAARPDGVAVREGTIPGPAGAVPVRRYRPVLPGEVQVVYFHGGGFVVGGLDSHDDICAEIALNSGCPVMSVDYRLAPEHPHPAAFEDALAAARAALDEGPVILAGDSAGGGLAASVAHALRASAAIRGQVLIYPGLGGEGLGLYSYEEWAEAPLLGAADVAAYARLRAGGEPPDDDPRFGVLAARALSGIAPCFASAAGVDPLRDEAVEYVRRLIGAGVPATCSVEPQLPHMWLRARHRSRRAARAFGRVLSAIAGFAASGAGASLGAARSTGAPRDRHTPPPAA